MSGQNDNTALGCAILIMVFVIGALIGTLVALATVGR